MKKIITLCSALLLITMVSCNKCEIVDDICTAELRIIGVKIQSANIELSRFDEVYTIRQRTGEKITYIQNETPIDNNYWVLTDEHHAGIKNGSDRFIFTGIKNGVKVFEEIYEIAGDNCHITKRTGKEIIVIQ